MDSTLNPSIINFSALGISHPGAWNESLYQAIDVVHFETLDTYVCLNGNKRLYRAQKANISELKVKIYHYNTILNDQMSMRYNVTIAFASTINKNQCFTLKLYPKTYASAIYGRCAIQSSDFNIYGSKDQPNISYSRRSTHRWSSQRMTTCHSDTNNNISTNRRQRIQGHSITTDNEITSILQQLKETNEIVCYIERDCPIIHNIQFQQLIQSTDTLLTLYNIDIFIVYTDHIFIKAEAETKAKPDNRGPESEVNAVAVESEEEEEEEEEDDQSDNDSTSDSVSEREIDRLLTDRERDILRSRDEHYYSSITDINK